MSVKKKQWNDYLWIWTIVYFGLGFFNILFAWLGMIDFVLPLVSLWVSSIFPIYVRKYDFPDLFGR